MQPQLLNSANKAIIDDIKKTLELQGHHLTGALEASLQAHVNTNGDVTELSASALGYIESLEKGIPASQINVPATLNAMIKYVELRMGYRGSKAAHVAYRILQKQAIEGNPTEASKRFSKIGERKHVVTNTFAANQDKYAQMIDQVVSSSLDLEFSKTKSETI